MANGIHRYTHRPSDMAMVFSYSSSAKVASPKVAHMRLSKLPLKMTVKILKNGLQLFGPLQSPNIDESAQSAESALVGTVP